MRAHTITPLPTTIETQAPWLESLETSVGGVLALVTAVAPAGAELELGQAEVGVVFAHEAMDVQAVLAWGDDAVGLGVLMANLRIAGGKGALVRGDVEAVLSGGQFDLPIGLAYEVYSMADRSMVSSPLALDVTHGGWNAYGAQLGVEVDGLQAQVFGAQGFAWDADSDLAPGPALGARARLVLGYGFSAGASGALLFDQDVELDAGLAEVDVSFAYADFTVDVEVLTLVTGAPGPATVGGYLQAKQALGRFEVAARADLVRTAGLTQRRFALAAAVEVWQDVLQFRGEVASDFGPGEEAVLLQAVAAL